MAEPDLGPVVVALEALQPQLAPALAHHGRMWRQRLVMEHAGAPGQHVEGAHTAALVVHVVGVAVVGGHERDDRLERRRPAGSHLQAVEPAPGDARHAHDAGAPRLLRYPGDGVADVLLLLGRVLVEQDAVGVAAAAQIEAQAGVAEAGPVRVHRGVTHAGAVGEAVGDAVDYGRHRLGEGVAGRPQARAKACAVGQRDPEVFDFVYLVRELRSDLHLRTSLARPGSRRQRGLYRELGGLSTLPAGRYSMRRRRAVSSAVTTARSYGEGASSC